MANGKAVKEEFAGNEKLETQIRGHLEELGREY